MTTVSRTQCGLLNSKRFYLSDGVVSLPYRRFLLTSIRENQKKYKRIHKKVMPIKDTLMREEFKACAKCERIRILRSVLSQRPTYYKVDSTKRSVIRNISDSTRANILGGMWQ